MVPLVFFFFLMNIPPVHPWDTNQENYNGLFKGFFEENKTIFSLVRKSGHTQYHQLTLMRPRYPLLYISFDPSLWQYPFARIVYPNNPEIPADPLKTRFRYP